MRSSLMILIVCAGLLLSGGSILGGSAIWCLMRMSYYFWLTDMGVELSYNVLYIAGSLLCLPSCWLTTLVPYHSRATAIMATLMCLLASSMVMLSIGLSSSTGMTRVLREPAAINQSMLHAMSLHHEPAIKSSFVAMQLELQCCGVNSHTDWLKFHDQIPPACCGRITNLKPKTGREMVVEVCSNPLFKNPCLPAVIHELQTHNNTLAILACCNIMVLAITLFTTAYQLVANTLERPRTKPAPAHAVRIACLSSTPITMPTTFTTANEPNKFFQQPINAGI